MKPNTVKIKLKAGEKTRRLPFGDTVYTLSAERETEVPQELLARIAGSYITVPEAPEKPEPKEPEKPKEK